jgi:hypothetical protein
MRSLEKLKDVPALKKEIEKRTGKSTEELYEEREKRVREAIYLKTPDRVPLFINAGPTSYLGVSPSAAYYDPVTWKLAIRQSALDFEPDTANAGFASAGPAWEALDVKNRQWPGGNLPADYEYQFIEGEYMKADEYDMLLNDPTDFIIRRYFPRIFGALAPLSKLPSMTNMFNGFEGVTALFASPEFEQLAKALAKAGREQKRFRELTGDASEELAQLGFPAFSHSGTISIGGAPFDTVSSALRGMTGSMTDMYRQPEKLIKACEVILERRIARSSPADPKRRGNPKRIGMPLWRGDKVFMSEAQFKKFYWPGLKKAMQAVIDLGYVPMPFFEAEFGDRLEYLLELPKGKVIASVNHVDVVRAREILKGHTCVVSGAPASLRLGSLAEFEDYYKRQLKACKKGGGFMMSMGLPKGKKEDLQAMVNRIKEYAQY